MIYYRHADFRIHRDREKGGGQTSVWSEGKPQEKYKSQGYTQVLGLVKLPIPLAGQYGAFVTKEEFRVVI